MNISDVKSDSIRWRLNWMDWQHEDNIIYKRDGCGTKKSVYRYILVSYI